MEPQHTQSPDLQSSPDRAESAQLTGMTQMKEHQRGSQLKWVFAIVVTILLAVIVGLVIALSQKSGSTSTSSTTGVNSDASSGGASSGAQKSVTAGFKIARTLTVDDQVDLIVYEPQQTGTNTTINFSLKNTCADCKNSRTLSAFSELSFNTTRYTKMYLLDQDAGQKYNPITDADGLPLATKSCVKGLKANEQIDCFASFAKVPSGKTVSVILGESAPKIDGIKVP